MADLRYVQPGIGEESFRFLEADRSEEASGRDPYQVGEFPGQVESAESGRLSYVIYGQIFPEVVMHIRDHMYHGSRNCRLHNLSLIRIAVIEDLGAQ
ncbi:hypothetical protein QC334_04300 [Streptomyces sp. DH18]|nr:MULTISPECIES: hypothetical protein [unclassified Streptomyces]MDG9681970.1 hypothetical protein [Streptomyces sp. DH18]